MVSTALTGCLILKASVLMLFAQRILGTGNTNAPANPDTAQTNCTASSTLGWWVDHSQSHPERKRDDPLRIPWTGISAGPYHLDLHYGGAATMNILPLIKAIIIWILINMPLDSGPDIFWWLRK